MEKDYYIHGKNKGGRVQKRSKLPLIGGLLALAVLIFALCFILFRPDAPAPEERSMVELYLFASHCAMVISWRF